MSRQHVQQQRLKQVSGFVSILTERMMTAYAVGSRPSENEVIAFCRGVLLLEEYTVPLPLFAEDVITRLQAQEDAIQSAASVQRPPRTTPRGSMLDRLLRPFKMLQAA